jgi:hypothetical protein
MERDTPGRSEHIMKAPNATDVQPKESLASQVWTSTGDKDTIGQVVARDGFVYVALMDRGGLHATHPVGSIVRVSRDGGAPEILATKINPVALAVDDAHVFWVNSEPSPGLMRAPARSSR